MQNKQTSSFNLYIEQNKETKTHQMKFQEPENPIWFFVDSLLPEVTRYEIYESGFLIVAAEHPEIKIRSDTLKLGRGTIEKSEDLKT